MRINERQTHKIETESFYISAPSPAEHEPVLNSCGGPVGLRGSDKNGQFIQLRICKHCSCVYAETVIA